MITRKIQIRLSFIPMILVISGLFYVNLHKTLQTFTVEEAKESTTLSFAGKVSPLAYYSVLSPQQGIITEVKAEYGQWVKKGDLLYVLDSRQLADSYRQSIEDLLRATSAYQNLLYQNGGNKELYRLGLISKISFMDNTQQLEGSALDLYEAKEKVNFLLEQSGQQKFDFQNMSLEKLQEFHEILKNPIRLVNIIAPDEGVLYFPSKTFGGDEDKPVKVARGTNIKEGQTLAVIGDMSGLLLRVLVNETDFHKISMGQKAEVIGSAFPDITLEGSVQNISRQANSSEDDASTPLYTIDVVVPKLTEEERKIIEVGMSAEINFITETPPVISIPLNAVFFKNGDYWVNVVNQKEQVEAVQVVPGTTGETTVRINKGLSSGDKIVLPD